MTWARMLAYITGTVDQELLLRNEYLAAEKGILRAQIKGRLLLSDAEKATLACVHWPILLDKVRLLHHFPPNENRSGRQRPSIPLSRIVLCRFRRFGAQQVTLRRSMSVGANRLSFTVRLGEMTCPTGRTEFSLG